MNSPDYKKTLEAVHAELSDLMSQRAQLDERMSQLKTTADALSKLVEAPPVLDENMTEGMGISDAIRHLLMSSQVPLTPREIKTKLVEDGFDITIYANPGAVIFNTLKRLEAQREITHVLDRAKNLIGYTYNHTSATRLAATLMNWKRTQKKRTAGK